MGIEELAYFTNGPDRKAAQAFSTLLRDFVARGRAASVVTVATTQKPSADVVPTFLRETRASRRMVGLPRFVAEELAAHLAGPGDPEVFVFTARQGGPLRVTGFRARVWRTAGLNGLRIHDLRQMAVALWIAVGANPRRSPLGPGMPR